MANFSTPHIIFFRSPDGSKKAYDYARTLTDIITANKIAMVCDEDIALIVKLKFAGDIHKSELAMHWLGGRADGWYYD